MIPYFKNYLKSTSTLPVGTGDLSTIDIFKIQNGEGHPQKKVVFPVIFNNDKNSKLIIYSARCKENNDTIINSTNNIVKNYPYSPQLYFVDYFEGIAFAGVENCFGDVVNLENQDDINLIFDFFKSTKKQDPVPLIDFYQEAIKLLLDKGLYMPDEIQSQINDLVGRDIKFPRIKQHGDFQPNNMFIMGDRLRIIDWDDYGKIDFPFFDAISIYLRIKKINEKQADEFIGRFFKELRFNEFDIKPLVIIYEIFNYNRKYYLKDNFNKQNNFNLFLESLSNIL
jgi:hypothetical protein